MTTPVVTRKPPRLTISPVQVIRSGIFEACTLWPLE